MAGYTFKSVKPQSSNAGAGQSANPYIRLVKADDILYFPERDKIDRVVIEGDIILKPGAKFFELYMTPSTHKKSLATEGDDDAQGFAQSLEGWHPGDGKEISAFGQNALNVGFVAITINCQGDFRRVYGSPCNPIFCTSSMEGTNEKTGWTFVFKQQIREGLVPAFYEGALPKVDPFAVTGSSIDFAKVNGSMYQLAPSATTTPLALTNVDFEHGEIVSLMGGGGDNPYELEASSSVMLKDGTTWVGLSKSVISLRVFKTATGTVFFETGRY